MLQITETEIKTRLAFDNPWWDEGAVDKRFRDWPKRAYFEGFLGLLKRATPHRATILMGPRRVGKTVMISQVIQTLLDEGVKPHRILYVSVDTPTYTGLTLEKLVTLFSDMHRHGRKPHLFVFFDEIQYHHDWERHLKSLVDSYPSVRFVASGSAAAALKMKSLESGAGRFTEFLLPPLNFLEFLRFRNLEKGIVHRLEHDPIDGWVEDLNDLLIDYMNFGGFPEAVLDDRVRADMGRFIANDIVDKVLLRDLPSLYGISDTQELKRLFTVLAYNTGQEVSYEGLSKSSGVAKNTLRKYLDYLEAAFLIRRLYRVNDNARRFKRVTHFKIYLTNPCIRTALFGPVSADDAQIGALVETVVVSQLAQSYIASMCFYARWKGGEVDLVSLAPFEDDRLLAVEIKWSDRFVSRARDLLGSLIEFCKRNNVKRAIVYSRASQGSLEVDGLRISYLPASLAAYLHAQQVIGMTEGGVSPHFASPLFSDMAALMTNPATSP